MRAEIDPYRDGPATARQLVDRLRWDLDPRTHEELRLLITELVTNALRHGQLAPGQRVRIMVSLAADAVRAEVHDPGRGFTAPAVPQPSPDGSSGWGLYLADRLSDRWGVDREGASTKVWVEKQLRPTAVSSAR